VGRCAAGFIPGLFAPVMGDAIVLHHIVLALQKFHPVEENLRQSFRALAEVRPKGCTPELSGVTIASLGVRFQMFNAAFFSSTIEGSDELSSRLEVASSHFRIEGRAWSLWVCEDWLSWSVRRRLSRSCSDFGLRIAAELPGMIADRLQPPKRNFPKLEIRRITREEDLVFFRSIGSLSFRVPPHWFAEVFDATVLSSRYFECWLALLDGEPVATAATVPSASAIGLYNVATVPAHRGHGIAEALTRHAAADAQLRYGPLPLVLQSTEMGMGVYSRLGFSAVTRIMAYVSGS
jgi:GNAT superfamily N-acetyltransferase